VRCVWPLVRERRLRAGVSASAAIPECGRDARRYESPHRSRRGRRCRTRHPRAGGGERPQYASLPPNARYSLLHGAISRAPPARRAARTARKTAPRAAPLRHARKDEAAGERARLVHRAVAHGEDLAARVSTGAGVSTGAPDLAVLHDVHLIQPHLVERVRRRVYGAAQSARTRQRAPRTRPARDGVGCAAAAAVADAPVCASTRRTCTPSAGARQRHTRGMVRRRRLRPSCCGALGRGVSGARARAKRGKARTAPCARRRCSAGPGGAGNRARESGAGVERKVVVAAGARACVSLLGTAGMGEVDRRMWSACRGSSTSPLDARERRHPGRRARGLCEDRVGVCVGDG
jgi:hypothetical protein